MKRTAHLLLIALLLAACGGWRGGDRLMSRADSLMYARPEADGRQLTSPAKGLNIVRMKDGSVKKVIVR